MTTYEPGTVAVATVRGVPNVRVFRADASEAMGQRRYVWTAVSRVEGRHVHQDDDVTDVRPLVVLDPEDREQVERLLTAYQSQYPLGRGDQWGTHADNMQAALRSLIAPPKPAEPTGLGAVVEDAKGNRWVRAFSLRLAWTDTLFSEDRREYADIDAARVLSEGVTA